MGLYTMRQWHEAREQGARYHVQVCWACWQPSAIGMVDTEHVFTSKDHAERFARAIARYLPEGDPNVGPVAWVLVSSIATSEAVARSCKPSLCYASYDAGGMRAKYHAPLAGYFGAPRAACAPGPVDTVVPLQSNVYLDTSPARDDGWPDDCQDDHLYL
jgi:hypothetical protein